MDCIVGEYHALGLALLAKVEAGQDTQIKQTFVRFPPLALRSVINLTAEPLDAIYVIERGVVEQVIRHSSREREVYGFHVPGSVLTLSTLLYADWGDALIAVEPASLCRVRTAILPMSIQRQFGCLITTQLRDEYEFRVSLMDLQEDQRLAAFLLRLSAQLDRRTFQLSMPDLDIARYLECSVMDIRLGLRQFVTNGWLRCSDREVALLDTWALLRLSNP